MRRIEEWFEDMPAGARLLFGAAGAVLLFTIAQMVVPGALHWPDWNAPGWLVTAIVVSILYFLPTVVAFQRKTTTRGMVFVLNLLLGWTILGWVIPLAMAYGPTELDADRRAGMRPN